MSLGDWSFGAGDRAFGGITRSSGRP